MWDTICLKLHNKFDNHSKVHQDKDIHSSVVHLVWSYTELLYNMLTEPFIYTQAHTIWPRATVGIIKTTVLQDQFLQIGIYVCKFVTPATCI